MCIFFSLYLQMLHPLAQGEASTIIYKEGTVGNVFFGKTGICLYRDYTCVASPEWSDGFGVPANLLLTDSIPRDEFCCGIPPSPISKGKPLKVNIKRLVEGHLCDIRVFRDILKRCSRASTANSKYLITIWCKTWLAAQHQNGVYVDVRTRKFSPIWKSGLVRVHCTVPIPFTGSPSEDELLELAEKIPGVWYQLSIKLGLDTDAADNIQHNQHHTTPTDKAFQALVAWRRRLAGNATYERLDKALSEVGRLDLVKMFCTGQVSIWFSIIWWAFSGCVCKLE